MTPGLSTDIWHHEHRILSYGYKSLDETLGRQVIGSHPGDLIFNLPLGFEWVNILLSSLRAMLYNFTSGSHMIWDKKNTQH